MGGARFCGPYSEGLVNRGVMVVSVGVGGIGSRCPLQLTSHAAGPLSCGEHFEGLGGGNWSCSWVLKAELTE